MHAVWRWGEPESRVTTRALPCRVQPHQPIAKGCSAVVCSMPDSAVQRACRACSCMWLCYSTHACARWVHMRHIRRPSELFGPDRAVLYMMCAIPQTAARRTCVGCGGGGTGVWSALEVVAGHRLAGLLRAVDHLGRLLKEVRGADEERHGERRRGALARGVVREQSLRLGQQNLADAAVEPRLHLGHPARRQRMSGRRYKCPNASGFRCTAPNLRLLSRIQGSGLGFAPGRVCRRAGAAGVGALRAQMTAEGGWTRHLGSSLPSSSDFSCGICVSARWSAAPAAPRRSSRQAVTFAASRGPAGGAGASSAAGCPPSAASSC